MTTARPPRPAARRRLRPTSILLALAAVATGLTVTTVAAPTASAETIECTTATGSSDFYAGPSASTTYDRLFGPAAVVPARVLDHFIPQGLATWPNWGGAGRDLVLLTAYDDRAGSRGARIIGRKPDGSWTSLVTLPYSHAGGVAVVNGHLFVSGEGNDLRRYRLAQLRAKLAGEAGALTPVATVNLGIPRISFLAVEGDRLYAGTHYTDRRGTMNAYDVSDAGGLSSVRQGIEIPTKTQGLVVTADHFIYSTSYGSQDRGNIYVVRRGHGSLDAAYPQDLRCFRAPSMGQGITRSNGRLYLAFESGSFRYRTDPCDHPQPFEGDCTRNVITRLHAADLSGLTSLT